MDFIPCNTFARKSQRILESAVKTCLGLEAVPQCGFESEARNALAYHITLVRDERGVVDTLDTQELIHETGLILTDA